MFDEKVVLLQCYNLCSLIFPWKRKHLEFRKDNMGNPHKIDVANMEEWLTTKPEVICICNSIIEEPRNKHFLPELKINILALILFI